MVRRCAVCSQQCGGNSRLLEEEEFLGHGIDCLLSLWWCIICVVFVHVGTLVSRDPKPGVCYRLWLCAWRYKILLELKVAQPMWTATPCVCRACGDWAGVAARVQMFVAIWSGVARLATKGGQLFGFYMFLKFLSGILTAVVSMPCVFVLQEPLNVPWVFQAVWLAFGWHWLWLCGFGGLTRCVCSNPKPLWVIVAHPRGLVLGPSRTIQFIVRFQRLQHHAIRNPA